MKKAYFQYYETFENIVQKFKTAEEREAIRTKIINYGLYGQNPEKLTDKEEMVWDLIVDLIDDQRHRREINTENRKTKKTNDNEKNESERNVTNTNEKNETQRNETNEKEIKSPSSEMNRNEMKRNEQKRNEVNNASEDAEHTQKRFKKPTVTEIQTYCNERHNEINAQRFYDFYESKGWKVGNTPMKDWKAAVRTWEQKSQTPQHYTSPTHPTLPEDRLTF